MANQEELQRIIDSTLRELAAIVEHHNRNIREQKKAALREELKRLKKEKDMRNEIRKGIEDSNQILTGKISEVVLHSKIQEQTKDRQLGRVENSTAEHVMEKEQAKMFFYHAMESCARKEERYIRCIRKLNNYINGLHSTLERNGIVSGRCTNQAEESDEYQSYESDDSNNQFENNDNGNYDEFEKQSYDEESQESSNTVAETSVLESNEAVSPEVDHYSIVAANPQESNWCDMIEAEELKLNQQSQLDEPEHIDLPENEPSCNDKDEESQKASNTVAETSVLESDEAVQLQVDKFSVVAANPQEPNWCDMIEAEELELNQQSQLDVPKHIDLAETEPNCKDKDKKSQEASNSVLESDEPVKPEVPQISKLVPSVHCFGEVKFEEVKKPKKKQQKRKLKPKSKFSTLTTFGRF